MFPDNSIWVGSLVLMKKNMRLYNYDWDTFFQMGVAITSEFNFKNGIADSGPSVPRWGGELIIKVASMDERNNHEFQELKAEVRALSSHVSNSNLNNTQAMRQTPSRPRSPASRLGSPQTSQPSEQLASTSGSHLGVVEVQGLEQPPTDTQVISNDDSVPALKKLRPSGSSFQIHGLTTGVLTVDITEQLYDSHFSWAATGDGCKPQAKNKINKVMPEVIKAMKSALPLKHWHDMSTKPGQTDPSRGAWLKKRSDSAATVVTALKAQWPGVGTISSIYNILCPPKPSSSFKPKRLSSSSKPTKSTS